MTKEFKKDSIYYTRVLNNILSGLPMCEAEKETINYCIIMLSLLSKHCIENEKDLIMALLDLQRLQNKELSEVLKK